MGAGGIAGLDAENLSGARTKGVPVAMPYETVTWKEIIDQPRAWEAALADAPAAAQQLRPLVEGRAEAVFCGCGTSYYLALAAAASWQGMTGQPARAVPASEVLFYPELVFRPGQKALFVAISRSGESSEVVAAARVAGGRPGIAAVAVTCHPASSLAKVCPTVLVSREGAERSLVMTKSFSSMLLLIQAAAASLARQGSLFDGLPALCGSLLDEANKVGSTIARAGYDSFVYLGAGPYFGLAQEGMLKIKEMAIVSSEAYHPLEYRHGPKAIAGPQTLVICLMSGPGAEQEAKLLGELQQQGAPVFAIGAQPPASVDYALQLPAGPEGARSVLAVVPCQVLGHHVALARGVNPDAPENLTQVVKVDI